MPSKQEMLSFLKAKKEEVRQLEDEIGFINEFQFHELGISDTFRFIGSVQSDSFLLMKLHNNQYIHIDWEKREAAVRYTTPSSKVMRDPQFGRAPF